MDATRSEAMKLAQEAKQQAAQDQEKKLKAVDADIGTRVAAAEERIRASVGEAMSEIEAVAAEAARELVGKLTGREVAPEEARQAVKASLNG